MIFLFWHRGFPSNPYQTQKAWYGLGAPHAVFFTFLYCQQWVFFIRPCQNTEKPNRKQVNCWFFSMLMRQKWTRWPNNKTGRWCQTCVLGFRTTLQKILELFYSIFRHFWCQSLQWRCLAQPSPNPGQKLLKLGTHAKTPVKRLKNT